MPHQTQILKFEEAVSTAIVCSSVTRCSNWRGWGSPAPLVLQQAPYIPKSGIRPSLVRTQISTKNTKATLVESPLTKLGCETLNFTSKSNQKTTRRQWCRLHRARGHAPPPPFYTWRARGTQWVEDQRIINWPNCADHHERAHQND